MTGRPLRITEHGRVETPDNIKIAARPLFFSHIKNAEHSFFQNREEKSGHVSLSK
jgi:hypothetical protein